MCAYVYINHHPQLRVRTNLPGITYMVMMMLVLRDMLLSLVVVGDMDLILVVMFHLFLSGLLLLSLSCLYTLIVILSISLMIVSAFWVGGMGINLLTLFYLYLLRISWQFLLLLYLHNMVGRLIEERRRHLTPDMVEVLSCTKDRELADLHMQHNLEKDTIEIYLSLKAWTMMEETKEANQGLKS
jgi:hypothetical protein